MRAFIAIELTPEVKDRASCLQEELRRSHADVSWVKPGNIHLTLKFLGEIDDALLQKITVILSETAQGHTAFSVRLALVGAFPKIYAPRVIWVGIDKGDEETKKIAADLETRIAQVGIPAEKKPFSSHITLGRVRTPQNRQKLVECLQGLMQDPAPARPEMTVRAITLFKSTLTPQGSIYEVLSEAPLKA